MVKLCLVFAIAAVRSAFIRGENNINLRFRSHAPIWEDFGPQNYQLQIFNRLLVDGDIRPNVKDIAKQEISKERYTNRRHPRFSLYKLNMKQIKNK